MSSFQFQALERAPLSYASGLFKIMLQSLPLHIIVLLLALVYDQQDRMLQPRFFCMLQPSCLLFVQRAVSTTEGVSFQHPLHHQPCPNFTVTVFYSGEPDYKPISIELIRLHYAATIPLSLISTTQPRLTPKLSRPEKRPSTKLMRKARITNGTNALFRLGCSVMLGAIFLLQRTAIV